LFIPGAARCILPGVLHSTPAPQESVICRAERFAADQRRQEAVPAKEQLLARGGGFGFEIG